MRYIVTVIKTELIPNEEMLAEVGGFDADESNSWEFDVHSVIPCEDMLGVSCAIGIIKNLKTDAFLSYDWSVFELVDGKFQRRAVLFNPSGLTVKEIV